MQFECFFCQITECTIEIQWFDKKKKSTFFESYQLPGYYFSVKLLYTLLKFFDNNFCLLFQKAKKPNFDDISFEIRPEVDKSAVSGSPATVTTTIPTKNNDKNNPESTATALSNNTSATAAGKDSKDKVNLLVS